MNLIRGALRDRAGVIHFVETVGAAASTAPLDLALTGEVAARAAEARGRDILLGIRPEDISEQAGGIALPVDVAEPMGAETHVHLRTASHRMVARLHTERMHKSGEILAVRLDPGKIHLFDSRTELALRV